MGGYVGFRRFYTNYAEDEVTLKVMHDDDNAESFASSYRMMCSDTRSVQTPKH